MRISKQWLCDFVALPSNDEELYHVLQMAGLGVDEHEGDVWTLEVTSNRGDWLSAIGLARDIAAMTDKHLHVPTHEVQESGATVMERVEVEIENPADCPRYAARLIENVQIGPSPDWIQQRLIECGMRPLNNIVDITNYVMLETGQPLHAFDAAKVLSSDGVHRIRVRRARDGESMVTLDEVERKLTSDVLLITDGELPIAVAGVMGGRDSEVGDGTTSVLLESAHFAPARVRRGKRVIGLASEASRRFERWVDPNGVVKAANRAAQLMQQYAGGQVAGGVIDRYLQPVEDARVTLRPARCNAVLGLRLSREQMVTLLQRLGFKIGLQSEDLIEVSVPTWRRDIEREIDVIEEIARIHGYDNIPTTLPRNANATAGRSLSQRLEERAKQALLRSGVSEIVTYSLLNPASVTRAGLSATQPAVKLRNPLSEDFSQLRTSLLPSLLESLGRNPRTPVRYFELGKVYLPRDEARPDAEQPLECLRVGIALLNAPAPAHWQKRDTGVDFFTLKSVVNNLFAGLGAPEPRFTPATHPTFHPGRCATLCVDGQELGVLGEVHPEVAERYELPHRAYLCELDWSSLVRHIEISRRYEPPVKFPPADRDLALVLKNEVSAARIESTLRGAGGELLQEVRIFDVYTGPPVPEGSKSVALSLRLRAADRTLNEEEIEAVLARLREQAATELGAQLRS
jgi:phenylalanyl-tRNA synthetase beta chain